MATKTKRRSKVRQKIDAADEIIAEQVIVIDEQLEKVEVMLRPYEELKERANRLRAARRALLGGSRTTGSGGTQVRQEDVIGFLREHPGSPPKDIAKNMGVRIETVNAHLYRGKGERFIAKNGRYWLRSPKDGMNTADDIEED